ncbi:hypothetical protein HOK51_05485 [Candidatus Woesearchaeota archaeon]|jgi:dihydroorotate dehydrogenase (NAD+) catalytic subunit|nr:hypothetical protein [Candidatus Woesearchaeota archaeon]MBT6519280.1 hypothetical protein [Candidatus Woesearchaeota archaeon]MBT7368472.1 hypothetical protein [Candidatus Woesearchaeota archaeon]
MPKLNLNPPLVNACGILSYLDVFELLEKKQVKLGAWIPKSIGPKEKLGNKNPTICDNNSSILNSFALPTQSIDGWIREFENSKLEKPIIGSAYGECPEDYIAIIDVFNNYVDAWELNISCPNKEPGEESLMESIHNEALEFVRGVRETTTKPLIAKLSPNEDYKHITKLIANYVDYLGCGNTIGPGLAIDIHSRRSKLAGIYGGISGPAIKPLNLKMVNDVYNIVTQINRDIEIIAYGGIETWEDIIEYCIAGASIFGIGTVLINKTAENIVDYTKTLWTGVENYLIQQDTTLEKLKGSLIK